ncbi:MAG: NAD(P)H-dependent oxidoreductase subunit [Bacteroidota bacterium]|nr:NAD(P)H-dependent oxidoreductase subunit [Bacteroidota bacterium]
MTQVITNQKKNGKCDGLISTLEDMQAKYGFLPEEELQVLAKDSGCSLVDIYGVATFYRAFSLKPRGNHLVSVCLGTACHVRNAPEIIDEFEQLLEIKRGDTTPNNEFTLETVNCLGACALGPIVVVDGHYYSSVNRKKVKSIIKETLEGRDRIEIKTDQRIFPLEVSCSRCNHSLMDQNHLIDGYPSIRVTVSFHNKHGWLALSSLYGSKNVSSEFPIPENIIVQIFCPHCHTELIGASNCPECGASMVPMIVRGGGIVQMCPRKGCVGHILDLSGSSVL